MTQLQAPEAIRQARIENQKPASFKEALEAVEFITDVVDQNLLLWTQRLIEDRDKWSPR